MIHYKFAYKFNEFNARIVMKKERFCICTNLQSEWHFLIGEVLALFTQYGGAL